MNKKKIESLISKKWILFIFLLYLVFKQYFSVMDDFLGLTTHVEIKKIDIIFLLSLTTVQAETVLKWWECFKIRSQKVKKKKLVILINFLITL